MDNGKLVKFEQVPVQGEIMGDETVERLRRLAGTPGAIEFLLRCMDQMPALQSRCVQLEDQCRTLRQRCDAMDLLCAHYVCPGTVSFSRRTLAGYSDDGQVTLDQVVQDFGTDFVNDFAVPPGKSIRLTHRPRPGYLPNKIGIDLNISGNGNNFLDFQIQFYLVPGGVSGAQGIEIGATMRANQFLNKNGTQIHIPFPEWEGCPSEIGSQELLAVQIKNGGGANNLDSAYIVVYYDNRLFYELCKKRCGCGSTCSNA